MPVDTFCVGGDDVQGLSTSLDFNVLWLVVEMSIQNGFGWLWVALFLCRGNKGFGDFTKGG